MKLTKNAIGFSSVLNLFRICGVQFHLFFQMKAQGLFDGHTDAIEKPSKQVDEQLSDSASRVENEQTGFARSSRAVRLEKPQRQ